MKIFSSRVEIGAGEPLGGSDPSRRSLGSNEALEVNGFAFTAADGHQYKLCAVDALYAGRLVDRFSSDESIHIFAASHTHYAPMLDDSKPYIGGFSQSGFDAYIHALTQAEYRSVSLTQCRLYRTTVDVPVYRRFDYPDNWWNRFLASHFGFYPNDAKEIDRSIYLFEFTDNEQAQFVVVYHACHPVSRGIACELSADYVGAIREAVRRRFAVETVLFLQGCAGDVRPNLARKRIKWLPKSRLNWKFDWSPAERIIAQVDAEYERAVLKATIYRDIALGDQPLEVSARRVCLMNGREIEFSCMRLPGGIEFYFLPFEVSHLYHMKAASTDVARFIVSCANDTQGYLSHPSQHRAGGYEVYGSLHYMGLKEKLAIGELI